MSARPVRLLSATLLALAALAACKGEKPAAPPKPAAVQAPAAPERTRDQAIAELMALPELKTWSEQIEKRSHGAAHGAVIEDDPTPRIIEGKKYYQLSFVEDRKQDVHRRASFLEAHEEVTVPERPAKRKRLRSPFSIAHDFMRRGMPDMWK